MAESQLGKYHIVEEIGRGGFATVYRAEDTTLGREVALKVLDPLLMREDTFVARFQREARAAARLDHPHIVPIFEVGEDGGRLYIAMRLVRGQSLAALLRERGRLSWDESLRILKQVGNALAYAHAEGVVHRDIKPDNILIDERSGALLSDFGFAQLIGSSSLTLSLSGGIVGTPAYIPPEIWDGKTATPASDIYALGCVLYEMLMGQALFDGATPMAVMRAHDQGAPLPETWPLDVPPEVAGIMPQAIARDPAERYPHIAAFMEALDAVQTAAVAERVAAETARLLQEMANALEQGRFETVITLGEALFKLQPDHAEGAALVAQARERLAQRQALEKHLAKARAAVSAEQTHLQTEQAQWEAQRAALDEKAQQRQAEIAKLEQSLKALTDEQETEQQQRQVLEEQLDAAGAQQEEIHKQAARLDHLAELLEQGQFETVEAEFADDTAETKRQASASLTPKSKQKIKPAHRVTARLMQADFKLLHILEEHRDAVNCLAFSPDSTVLASGSDDGRILLWWKATKKFKVREIYTTEDQIMSIAYSPNSDCLAFGYSDGTVEFLKLPSGDYERSYDAHDSVVWGIDFSLDGEYMATGGADGIVRIWRVRPGFLQSRLAAENNEHTDEVTSVQFSPAGNAVISGALDGRILVWRFDGTIQLSADHQDKIETVAFSPAGNLVASAGADRTIKLWQISDGELVNTLPHGHSDIINSIAFSPDGELLASGGEDSLVNLWRVSTGELLQTLKGHTGFVSSVAFAPDGNLLASASKDKTIRLWGISPEAEE